MRDFLNGWRLPLSLLAAGVLLALTVWLPARLAGGVTEIQDERGAASVRVTMTPARAYRPGDCFTITWAAEGIAAIQFDGRDTVGEGSETRCDNANITPPSRLNVTFTDGAVRTYTLQPTYITALPGYGIITVFAGVLLYFGAALALDRLSLRLNPPRIVTGVVGGLLLVGVGVVTLLPAPRTLTDTVNGASLVLMTQDARTLWLQPCITVAWAVEGVQAVYLNGAGTVGSGTETTCEREAALTVTLPDDTEAGLTLARDVVLLNPVVWVAVVLGVGLVLISLPQIFGGRAAAALLESVGGVGLILFAVMTYGLSWFGVYPAGWLMPILIVALLGGVGLAWRRRDNLPRVWGVFYLPFLVFLPGIVAQIIIPAARLTSDGDNHSNIVYTMLVRGVPPENAWMAGNPATSYWTYHGLLAALAEAFNISPATASSIVGTVILMGILYWCWRAVVDGGLIPDESGGLLAGAAVLFLLLASNPLALFIGIYNAQLNGFPHGLAAVGAFTGQLLEKIQTFNGFSLGILFFVMSLAASAGLMRRGANPRDAALFVLAFTGAVLYHATTAVYMVWTYAVGLVLWGLTLALRPHTLRMLVLLRGLAAAAGRRVSINWRDWLAVVVGCGVLVVIAAVYLLTVSGGARGGVGFNLFFVTVLTVGLPLLPFALVSIWGQSRFAPLLVALAGAGYGGALLLDLAGQNYKLILLSGIPLGGAALVTLSRWAVEHNSSVRRGVGRGMLALVVVNYAYLGVTLFLMPGVSPLATNTTVYFDGQHTTVSISDEVGLCMWMRENTAPDAVIVKELRSIWDSYDMMCERAVFLAEDFIYTTGVADFQTRARFVRRVFEVDAPPETRLAALEAVIHYPGVEGRPVYLQLSERALETLAPYLPEDRIVYADAAYTLYRVD